MENLEKDQPRLNKLLDSINYIRSKKLNCEDNKKIMKVVKKVLLVMIVKMKIIIVV